MFWQPLAYPSGSTGVSNVEPLIFLQSIFPFINSTNSSSFLAHYPWTLKGSIKWCKYDTFLGTSLTKDLIHEVMNNHKSRQRWWRHKLKSLASHSSKKTFVFCWAHAQQTHCNSPSGYSTLLLHPVGHTVQVVPLSAMKNCCAWTTACGRERVSLE